MATTLPSALMNGAVWCLGAAALLPLLMALAPRALGGVSRALLPARTLVVVGSLALAVSGALALAGRLPAPLMWWPGLPGEPFVLGLDALAAPFVTLAGLVAAASFAAHAREGSPAGAAARLALHAAFVLALAAVLLARHALLFLVAWEGMTLASAALVASDPSSARGRSATYVYLAMSHVGAGCIAFGLLKLAAAAGSFQFPALAAAYAALPAAAAAQLAWIFTIGFAVKLGLVPVHAWLPLAHPEAPPAVSALLSGVMVKTGLYGMLRFAWQWPGAPPEHWGTVLLVVGGLTAVAAAVSAVLESDAKRLLAWSTIKNAGVLASGTGLAALLSGSGQPALAQVALAAVFAHTIGHGLAKALAFIAVGEAAHAAGTRRLDAMGALAKPLPRVAWAALAAALALCALPGLPLFASEWLLYQTMILGYSGGNGLLRLLVPFAGAGLALATAVTVAAMVKLHGLAFLGRSRRAPKRRRCATRARRSNAPRSRWRRCSRCSVWAPPRCSRPCARRSRRCFRGSRPPAWRGPACRRSRWHCWARCSRRSRSRSRGRRRANCGARRRGRAARRRRRTRAPPRRASRAPWAWCSARWPKPRARSRRPIPATPAAALALWRRS